MYFLAAILIYFISLSEQKSLFCRLDNPVAAISPQCLKQLNLVCDDWSTLWAMTDASSKYPISGMSYSNNRDLGNYDQCVNIRQYYASEDVLVKGKFCALSVAVVNPLLSEPIPDPYVLLKPKDLAQHKINVINHTELEQLKDSGIPYIVTALSTCVPDQCTAHEVGIYFLWGTIPNLINFVEEVPCMTIDSNTNFQWGDILFITFLSFILALIVASTAYDFVLHKTNKETQHPLYLAFSLITNVKKLIHINYTKNPEQIQCFNGLRFISMMWVLAGHAFVALEQAPLINYKEIRGMIDNVTFTYMAPAPISVDTFFFLSGFLLAFGYLKSAGKQTPKRQAHNIPMMIIHRYLRLTPAVAVLYFASITIFRMTGSGPLWGAVSKILRETCENHWWPFFLYIQNYVNYDDICLNHTWYLSADMQMFILAPIVLIPLCYLINTNRRNLGIGCLIGFIVVCIIFPMGIRFADQNIKNIYDTHSRFNDYLIGVLLAVILRDPRFKRFPFHKLTNLAIWCVVLLADIVFMLYYHSIVRIYEHTSDTLFYGLYRPVWCFSLFWMVYSCYHGHGGFVNWFLSLPAFQIGARLSYCMYLLHAVVVMYYIGLIRTPYYWGNYIEFYLWCGHLIVTMILSVIWSLAFESPMIVIEKYLFGGARAKK